MEAPVHLQTRWLHFEQMRLRSCSWVILSSSFSCAEVKEGSIDDYWKDIIKPRRSEKFPVSVLIFDPKFLWMLFFINKELWFSNFPSIQ